ncbi:MAG: hypothetical protein OXI59_19270, partial [Gemmatimonadota bacterium]|nr:hypothetical protein [Gemmatimonadota bacterium]
MLRNSTNTLNYAIRVNKIPKRFPTQKSSPRNTFTRFLRKNMSSNPNPIHIRLLNLYALPPTRQKLFKPSKHLRTTNILILKKIALHTTHHLKKLIIYRSLPSRSRPTPTPHPILSPTNTPTKISTSTRATNTPRPKPTSHNPTNPPPSHTSRSP